MTADFTQFSQVSSVLNGLTPHIEERALRYALHRGVMPQRVLLMTDMSGWNVRKVSEYIRPRNAVKLDEGVAIPDALAIRKRLAEISPYEWGDSYPVSERRYSTDLEPILTDVIRFLGESLAVRREKLLQQAVFALATSANTISQTSNVYDLAYQTPLQVEFEKNGLADDGQLWHVIHPYQSIGVKNELIKLTNAANPTFRDAMINSWRVGGFGNLDVASTSFLPRRMVYKISVTGSAPAGTFKLRAGEIAASGLESVTGDITINTTHATMLSNILAALNALTHGTWTGSSTALDNITITAPTGYYVDVLDELRLPLDADGDPDTSGLTGYPATTNVTIVEKVGATAKAPMFFRSVVAWDVRKPVTFESEWHGKYRVAENYISETYGVAPWRSDRVLFVETKCESPFAAS